jgi:hypothetical protein
MDSEKLYYRMKSENDFTPILTTAVRECGVENLEHADRLLDAFLQWFSIIPSVKESQKLQMIREVDPIWHALILNTKFYRNFCSTYIGKFIDHDPTDVELEEGKEEYARFTLSLLRKTFSTNLNEHLCLLAGGATCCFSSGCGSDPVGGDDDGGGDARTNVIIKELVC